LKLERCATLPNGCAEPVTRHRLTSAGLLTALLLSACGGGGGDVSATDPTTTSEVLTALVAAHPEPAGASCAAGGTRIDAGFDANGNGTLDSTEAGSTQYVCNGVAGERGATGAASRATLVTVVDAGTHCANGGKAVNGGVDTNGDSALQSNEITSTDHLCNGAPGAAGPTGAMGAAGIGNLLVSIAEPGGPNCTWGGSKITSGADTNANGILALSEVTSTTFVCSGAPGSPGVVADVTNALNVGTLQATSFTTYLANSDTRVSLRLPSAPAVGDTVTVSGVGLGGWTIAQNAGQSIYTGFSHANWAARLSNTQSWLAVGMSGNGKVVLATAYAAPAYISFDGGVTFAATTSEAQIWTAATVSQDGSHMLVAGYNSPVQVSMDSGTSWQHSGVPSDNWPGVAMSPDGQHMAAVSSGHGIWASSDGGATWSATGAASRNWQRIAMSADGSRLVATEAGGDVWLSADGGATWAASGAPHGLQWLAVASSDDGMRLVATVNGGVIYTSTDAGATWVARQVSSTQWIAVTSSADGRRLTAADSTGAGGMSDGGYIYSSSDYGVHWNALPSGMQRWSGLAVSRDGLSLATLVYSQVQVVHAQTETGTSGAIGGNQFDTVTLQYGGNGVFAITGQQGSVSLP
jgi:photosystem II stability/assembly factor-like uncharacterized protein